MSTVGVRSVDRARLVRYIGVRHGTPLSLLGSFTLFLDWVESPAGLVDEVDFTMLEVAGVNSDDDRFYRRVGSTHHFDLTTEAASAQYTALGTVRSDGRTTLRFADPTEVKTVEYLDRLFTHVREARWECAVILGDSYAPDDYYPHPRAER